MKVDNKIHKHYINYLPHLTPPQTNQNAIINLGCNAHYVNTLTMLHNKTLAHTPIAVQQPNGMHMKSTHTGVIIIGNLPVEATQAHVLPDLGNLNLLSVGQLCNSKCMVLFDTEKCTIF